MLVTKLCISNSPPQVGRCSKHFQLEMRKYKEMHQENENTRKDAGNTSAKSIVNNQMLLQQEKTTTQGLTAWRKKQQINA